MQQAMAQLAGNARMISIAQIGLGSVGDTMRANLGSCVGLCVAWPKRGTFALAHILLPKPRDGASEPPANPIRFASTAVPHLLDRLGVRTARSRSQVVAFVAGGSNLYDSAQPVGEANRRELSAALAAEGIEVLGTDFGGTDPRQLVVDGPGGRVFCYGLREDEHLASWPIPLWG